MSRTEELAFNYISIQSTRNNELSNFIWFLEKGEKAFKLLVKHGSNREQNSKLSIQK